MPRIKLTDIGGFSVPGQGLEIDMRDRGALSTRSSAGCIQGFQWPITGSLNPDTPLIVGANTEVQSDHPDYGYDGNGATIDMSSFVVTGNVVRFTLYIAVDHVQGTPGTLSSRVVAAPSPVLTSGTMLCNNSLTLSEVGSADELISFLHELYIYDADDLTAVKVMCRTAVQAAGHTDDVSYFDNSSKTWNSTTHPFWSVAVAVFDSLAEDGTGNNSDNYYTFKQTVDCELIGRRSN